MRSIFVGIVFVVLFVFPVSSLRKVVRAGGAAKNLVVEGWGDDVNSNISTRDDTVISLAHLSGKNVSDVVATEQAFAVRVAYGEEEAKAAYKTFSSSESGIDAHEHNVALGSRPPTLWVIWGEPEFGGTVPPDVLSFLRDASTWPSEIAETGSTVGHVIYANDLCPLKDAFVAILKGKMACWGNAETCTGWQSIMEDRESLSVEKVLCAVNGYAGIPLLNGGHPLYKAHLSLFGRPLAGGRFPTSANFMQTIESSKLC